MTAPLDLPVLRETAQAATSGPWVHCSGPGSSWVEVGDSVSGYGEVVASNLWPHDAAYLAAASPDAVLALIAHAERADEMEARVREMEAEVARLTALVDSLTTEADLAIQQATNWSEDARVLEREIELRRAADSATIDAWSEDVADLQRALAVALAAADSATIDAWSEDVADLQRALAVALAAADCAASNDQIRSQLPTELPLAVVLAAYEDGDAQGWDAAFSDLYDTHRDRIDPLLASVRENGIQEPITIGTDGRIWDGHHRLAVAKTLNLATVPVRFAVMDGLIKLPDEDLDW